MLYNVAFVSAVKGSELAICTNIAPSWASHSPIPFLFLFKVARSSLSLCNPMDCSTPGLPVHHQLPEFTQTHVHSVGDAIQPSHPLSFPSPPAFNLSQRQGILLGSKITVDSDDSCEIKKQLPLGRKVMTNLDSILKSRDITLPTKVCLVRAVVFPVVMYGCESWTIKKAEC